ncbi:polymer-forming cytoskeletal protein [Sansalvadorimonas sp. 2012CJ34-2]|uniref:Polymer-forming cytoskeletal protein n=1 Tax=Parendozoicomonas callyspongiae TaxID=2942213 RepID=A0ABT0PGJ5_9GAMM|nr:polymer-forming cytoskeletal protein [Sansalvadorimonas sp. 2012CJ34-2]MCL6270497.1 polymer-forming cytoskeletal protein [Sansalvadorimonas sp. 2012CJ34-2]
MWGKKQSAGDRVSSASGSDATTLISEGTEIRGDMIFRGSMHVEGRVIGNIQAHEGTLRLADGGLIEGDIRVSDIVINGTVKGDVFAAGKLELASKADISGNVYYNTIEMVVGAQVNGVLERVDAPDTLEPPRELGCVKEPEIIPAPVMTE